MASNRVSSFQDSWLTDPRFSYWIKRNSTSTTLAICKLCNNKNIDVSGMGASALTSHANGVRHRQKAATANPLASLFFSAKQQTPPAPTSVPTATSSTSNDSTQTNITDTSSTSSASNDSTQTNTTTSLTSSASNDSSQTNTATSSIQTKINSSVASNVLDAEIRWCLKLIESHGSYRSCLDLNRLFSKMFPDSEIASKIKLSKTKSSYIIPHGIAPYFFSMLVKDINTSPYYSLSYDESLNTLLQKEQMDVQIRYWSEEKVCSETRYFTSKFFYRPNADTIMNQILDASSPLDNSRLSMLGQDGPSTNLLVLEKMHRHREENELPVLARVGSCGLHVTHGAFETGFKKTSWKIDGILKAMYRLLQDSPARRDVYLKETGLTNFPKRY